MFCCTKKKERCKRILPIDLVCFQCVCVCVCALCTIKFAPLMSIYILFIYLFLFFSLLLLLRAHERTSNQCFFYIHLQSNLYSKFYSLLFYAISICYFSKSIIEHFTVFNSAESCGPIHSGQLLFFPFVFCSLLFFAAAVAIAIAWSARFYCP